MGVAEQLEAVVRRFAAIAPARWAQLIGNWEATATPGAEVHLNWITTAVVDGGDRWLYGQVGYDEELYDAVARLHELAAQDGPDRRWTTLDLRVARDGDLHVDFGYGTPKRTHGIHDEESLGRFETYLDAWVAEHGPVPPPRDDAADEPARATSAAAPTVPAPVAEQVGPAPVAEQVGPAPAAEPVEVALTDEQRALLAQIVDDYPGSAPAGWVRIVQRVECVRHATGSSRSMVQLAIARTPDGGLVEDDMWDPPPTQYWETSDLLDDLLAASSTGFVVLSVVLDRDGRRDVRVVELDPSAPEPDPSPGDLVRRHLELNRAELEELAARV